MKCKQSVMNGCAFSGLESGRCNYATANFQQRAVLMPSSRSAAAERATWIGWLRAPRRRTRLALLQDDSTMQRKEWGLCSQSSVVGQHQSVWRSTKSTAVSALFLLLTTERAFPGASPDLRHASPVHGQQMGYKSPLCWSWLVKTAKLHQLFLLYCQLHQFKKAVTTAL